MKFIILLPVLAYASCVIAQGQEGQRYRLTDGKYYADNAGTYRFDDGKYKYEAGKWDDGRYKGDSSGRYSGDAGKYRPDDSGRYRGDFGDKGDRGGPGGKYTGDKDKYKQDKSKQGGQGGQGGFGLGSGGAARKPVPAPAPAPLPAPVRAPAPAKIAVPAPAKVVAPVPASVPLPPVQTASRVGAGSALGSGFGSGNANAGVGFGGNVQAPKKKVNYGAGVDGWNIIRKIKKLNREGYYYDFENENQIKAQESGRIFNKDTDDEGLKSKGFYEYIGDDGEKYRVDYTADENGFIPTGNHIPTPPPIPELIQRALDYVARLQSKN